MLRGFRGRYAGAMVSLALSTSAKAGTFFLIRYLVDEVLQRPDLSQRLPWVALGFILLALTEGAFTFLSGRLASGTAEGIALRLRNQLFDHIQRLSFGYHDRTPTGDLITRVTSDVDAVRRFFAEQAIGIGRIALLFTVNGIALWQLNTQLALFSVMVVPLVLVMSVFFFKRVSKVYEQYQEQDSKLSTTLQENLTGVRVVKAFARQAYEQDKFEQDNWEKFQRGRRFLLMHSMFWPAADVLCNTQIISGFTFGAFLAMQGTISLGDYLAYMGLVVQLIWPMRELGRMIVQASTGIVSHGRIMEVLNEAQEPISAGDYAPAEQRVQGALAFRGVGFDYRGESRVLKDITFDAQPGQVVALLGPTGSGKTSLVNLLPRFYDYTAGSLTLDGVELTRYPRQFLRQQIGMVEQQAFLFSRTIRENIAYGVGRNVTDEQVEAAARAAAIHDVILSFPDGYNTLVGEKGITLSGGQKQRVAIARTLLKDPRILILDDSTSAVDTETEALIRGALETLMQGRTTFIIAHRLQSVMNADLIVVLEHGRIAQMGAHAELLQQDGLYRRIYDLQARIEVEVEKEVGPAAAPVDALESPTTHEARELELMAV
jgi:ATP-binding cassette subfamily B protein